MSVPFTGWRIQPAAIIINAHSGARVRHRSARPIDYAVWEIHPVMKMEVIPWNTGRSSLTGYTPRAGLTASPSILPSTDSSFASMRTAMENGSSSRPIICWQHFFRWRETRQRQKALTGTRRVKTSPEYAHNVRRFPTVICWVWRSTNFPKVGKACSITFPDVFNASWAQLNWPQGWM